MERSTGFDGHFTEEIKRPKSGNTQANMSYTRCETYRPIFWGYSPSSHR